MEEYGISEGMIALSYEDLGPHTLGTTKYLDDGSADVIIHERLRDFPLTRESVAWHEFCHAEHYIRTGTSDHHEYTFYLRLLRKPLLAAWDLIGAKLIFKIVA